MGQCNCDASDFIKNVIEEMKRLSQNSFQDLYNCWQKCTVELENDSERNVAYMIVLFSISQK
jgi:galactose-1-phosphate uridylyltransferase